MAYAPPPAGRTLIGYQSPDDAQPRWTVVPGRLADGPDGVADVRLMSDDRTREITVNLPDKPGAAPLRSIDVPMPEGGVQRFDLPAAALTLTGALTGDTRTLTPTLSPLRGRGRTIRSMSRIASRVPTACLPSPAEGGRG